MIVEELSKFIVNLNYNDIPKTAIDKAKLCFLDFLGVSNRGFHEESTQIAIKSLGQLQSFDSGSESKRPSIIGDGYSSIANAGFINGISAHSLDLDDGHRFAQLHPGCVVFPSALAIAEANEINGKKFIEAVVGGYEVAIVLGSLANPNHRNQGFHSTGTIGTFAAGAVTSKLLNLNLEETINTLGLCGTQSSGLLESDHQGTMGKQLHPGKAVYNGIFSGYLAKNGFTGAESIIDGDEGFLKAMATGFFKDLNENNPNNPNHNNNNNNPDNYNNYNNNGPNNLDFKNYLSSYLAESIGKFHINEVYFKKYPFCRHLHSSIDATLNIKSKFKFNINDIEKIIIKTYDIAAEHNNFNPTSKEDIKQSLPYAVATAIVKNNLALEITNIINIIENNRINQNNSFKQILNKIIIEKQEEFTESVPKYRPSKVIIETKNEIYEDFVELPLGEVENPFSKEDLLEKFKNLNSNSNTNPNFDFKILNSIDNLENYNIYEFMESFH